MAVMLSALSGQTTGARPTWYEGDRYYWNGPLDRRTTYNAYIEKIPDGQRKRLPALYALHTRGPEHLGLDLSRGEDHPHIGYVSGQFFDAEVDLYLDFPDVSFLDLHMAELSDTALRKVVACKASSLALPRQGPTELGHAPVQSASEEAMRDVIAELHKRKIVKHLEISVTTGPSRRVLEPLSDKRGGIHSLQLGLRGIDDSWMEQVAKLETIHGIRLNHVNISEKGMRLLVETRHITHLALVDCDQMSPEWFKPLAAGTSVQELQLGGGVELTDECIAAMGEQPTIERLFLDGKSLTPRAIESVGRWRQLRVLVLNLVTPEVEKAGERWQAADHKHRKLYLYPDAYLNGWMEGLPAEWVRVRGLPIEMLY